MASGHRRGPGGFRGHERRRRLGRNPNRAERGRAHPRPGQLRGPHAGQASPRGPGARRGFSKPWRGSWPPGIPSSSFVATTTWICTGSPYRTRSGRSWKATPAFPPSRCSSPTGSTTRKGASSSSTATSTTTSARTTTCCFRCSPAIPSGRAARYRTFCSATWCDPRAACWRVGTTKLARWTTFASVRISECAACSRWGSASCMR